ncbi:MAG: hypothetical protein RMJ48_09305 [Roseiflexaceae bacterium]|nr:hypothetical protein [Roseiflexaceae bacterium]
MPRCDAARRRGRDGETLLRAGMLGVIAMRGAVSTEASAAFLDGLLDAVSDGQPLEVAAAAGRRAILARCGEQSEWFVPVCWQRALHRSLTLAPPLLLRRGATRLADKAPSWAAQLASGGALGLLLASALAPLLPATGVTTSALVTLLGNLGLNVFSGYLGEALAKVWRRTGGGPEIATPDEVAAALQEIVQSQADAATHLADLAHASRATGVLVEAINRGVAGNTALLEGLQRDLAAHGAALGGLRADLHAGLAAVYQEQLGLRRVAEETRDLSRDANRKLDQLLGQAEAAERERLLGYLERIAPECNRLTFFAAESSDTSRAALTLDAIYVRLEVERAGEEARADREEQRRTALRALAERPRLVLLGSPGLGKSTFVNHVVRCLALAYLHPSEDWRAHLGDDWTHGALLPIRVLLRELAGYVMERQIRTADAALLWSHLGAKYDAEIAAALQRQARAGNALLLLDGLDEVQVNDDGWPLNVVRDSITMLPDALGRGSRILVTCRVLDYGDSPPRRLPGWPDERLAPLSDKLRLTFVERYYRALLALNRLDAARAAELQQGLARSIQTRRELARLAGNPLLLTMMAQVHTSEGELPGTRVQLYDLCVRWLMSRWNPRPGERPLGEQLGMREWNESNLYELMELIGHTAHLHGTFPDSESGADLSYGVLRDVVSSYFNPTADPARQAESDRRAAIFAGYISRASNGLLQVHAEPGARQAIYRFPHRTFQEYLAGRALICPARHDGEESAYGEGVSTTIRSHMLGLQTPGCAPVA